MSHSLRAQITGTRAARLAAAALLASLLLIPGAASADDPAPQPACALSLRVELTPDVPNPSDGGFISSLLGDHPGYQLTLQQVVDDTRVDLRLYGPGPVENCQDVVESMRRDGRVVSIDVR